MKKIIIYSLLTVLVLLACKKEEELVFGQGTTLKIEIKDEAGVVIKDKVAVHLYTNKSVYLSDLANQSPVNSIYQTVSTTDGTATFEGINGGQVYYIYINYNGKSYTLNNFYGQHTLETPLLANAITSLSIELKPFNVGRVAFWTGQNNLSHIGIDIFIGDSLIGTINNVSTSVPTDSNDPNVLPVFYQTSGTYTIEAKAKNGCFWTYEITVDKDQFTPVEITSCEAGSVMFWAKPTTLATNGILEVFINEELVKSGQITTGRASTPTGCSLTANDYLTIERPKGDYTYKVVSTGNVSNCVWVGEVSFSNGCGQAIELVNCQ